MNNILTIQQVSFCLSVMTTRPPPPAPSVLTARGPHPPHPPRLCASVRPSSGHSGPNSHGLAATATWAQAAGVTSATHQGWTGASVVACPVLRTAPRACAVTTVGYVFHLSVYLVVELLIVGDLLVMFPISSI